MKNTSRFGATTLALLCLSFAFASSAYTQSRPASPNPVQPQPKKDAPMTLHATGTFEVKVAPRPLADNTDGKAEGSTLGRMSLDKQFHGDLEAVSKGEMLTAGTDVKDSAAYVAIERVTGKLNGRSGSFVLQHSGTMSRGELQMSVTVVPDSGSGQLVGLAGKMTITAANGQHSYTFDYTLPATP